MRMHSKEDDFDLDEIMREAEEAEDVSDETAEMPEEEVEAKISEGLVAMEYLLSEVYDEMLANNLLK